MAKQETKTPKFELSKLNSTNIVELDGWKEKQQLVINENPFIEIVDRETYEIAKTRRTALVTARTEIQKQDKLIAKVVSTFRRGTMEFAKQLIDITVPFEEKQQIEVSRYEAILEEKRNEKKLIEEKRIKTINDKIESVRVLLNDHLDLMTFENIKDTEHLIDDEIVTAREFDFEEYAPMMDEIVSNIGTLKEERISRLKEIENDRVYQEKKDQESEMNRRLVLAQSEIDKCDGTQSIFESIESIFKKEFVFGEFQDQVNQHFQTFTNKAKDKIEAVEGEMARRKEIKHQENQNRIKNVREGLLDQVFQMTVDDYDVVLDEIKESLEQENPFPELQHQFDEMIETVQKNIDSKMKMINHEIEQRNIKIEEVKKVKEKQDSERIEVMKKHGMTYDVKKKTFIGLGVEILDREVLDGDLFEVLLADLNNLKNKHKDSIDREKRLKKDKTNMIKYLKRVKNDIEFVVENEELNGLIGELSKSFDDLIESQIVKIQEF